MTYTVGFFFAMEQHSSTIAQENHRSHAGTLPENEGGSSQRNRMIKDDTLKQLSILYIDPKHLLA